MTQPTTLNEQLLESFREIIQGEVTSFTIYLAIGLGLFVLFHYFIYPFFIKKIDVRIEKEKQKAILAAERELDACQAAYLLLNKALRKASIAPQALASDGTSQEIRLFRIDNDYYLTPKQNVIIDSIADYIDVCGTRGSTPALETKQLKDKVRKCFK